MEAQALILAAGMGTRMKSQKPKVAHEMLGKPLVRWVVDASVSAGCTQVHVVVGHGREQVEPLLDDCVISYQNEMLGTGHTIMCAADSFGDFAGTIVVLCGDTPLIRAETIRALIDTHEAAGNAATVLTMKPDDPTGYGRILRTPEGNVCGIVEEKDCTEEQRALRECNSGMYCFDARALLDNINKLSRDNAQGEYYLTDMLAILDDAGCKVGSMVVEDDDECLGVNSRRQLAQATKVAQARINGALMDSGVTMLDPDTVWIGPECSVERDCTVFPLTILMGKTHVAQGCTLGPNTRLTNVEVGPGSVLDETVATDAKIGADVVCGPRVTLEPGAVIPDGAVVKA